MNKKAQQQIQHDLNQPGHKEEKKRYNDARRGERIGSTKVIPSGRQKAKERAAVKEETRKEME